MCGGSEAGLVPGGCSVGLGWVGAAWLVIYRFC